jgi:hypothetical protein
MVMAPLRKMIHTIPELCTILLQHNPENTRKGNNKTLNEWKINVWNHHRDPLTWKLKCSIKPRENLLSRKWQLGYH